jgi:glycosyltransferase involved in cell wall biosynthesis
MKIVFVTDSYVAGTGRFMNIAPEILRNRGHEVEVLTSTAQDESDVGELPPYVTRLRGRFIMKRNFYPGLIAKMLFGEKPDIVHSYVMGFFSTFVSGYLKRIRGYNLVVEPDISVNHLDLNRWKYPFFLFYKKIPTAAADSIIVFTEEQKNLASSKLGFDASKIDVLPWGIDFDQHNSKPKMDLRKDLGLEGKFVALNVGQIIRDRNLEALIKVASNIEDKNFVMLSIGSFQNKDYENELKGMVDSIGLQGKFIFLGPRPLKDIVEFYKMADIFVQMSRTESFCKPIVEAAASGLPIVSTNVGIGKDIVKDFQTGFIVRSEEDASEKIELLIHDENLRKEIGAKCREAARRFDWKVVIDKLEGIYKDIIEGRHG